MDDEGLEEGEMDDEELEEKEKCNTDYLSFNPN